MYTYLNPKGDTFFEFTKYMSKHIGYKILVIGEKNYYYIIRFFFSKNQDIINIGYA